MNLGMESETVEFKKSTGEMREAMESVAAILNKHGRGTLFFGVRPSDGKVIGQEVSEKTLRDISQAFTNRIEPRVYPEISQLETDEGLAYIKVAFSGNERPYSCDGRYRIRSADEDLPMNQSALRSFMQDEFYRAHPWDRQASERPIEDVDELTVHQYVERGQARGRIGFQFESVRQVLSSIDLLTSDGKLTNAAEVLFCPSIDVQLKMGIFKTHARTEALDLRHESGTIFALVDQAEFYIANNIRREIIVTGSRTRDEIPEIPFAAIREALMNAYAHRIWYRSGYVQVDIYHDAVDIISPGWFVDGQTPGAHLSGESTSSDTRNKLMAEALFRSGDIESSGMGIKKIRDLCDEAGVKVTYEEVSFGTKLTFHRKDPFGAIDSDKVRESAGIVREKYAKSLSKTDYTVLEFIGQAGTTRNTEVAEHMDMSLSGARKALQRLINKGLVVRDGQGKSTLYRLADKD